MKKQTHIVGERSVNFRMSEEELDDGLVSVLGGTHEGGGSVLVLDVDAGAGLDEQFGGFVLAMGGGEHEGGLSVLEERQCEVGYYSPRPENQSGVFYYSIAAYKSIVLCFVLVVLY